jgi:hypothetical protein
MSRVSGPDGVQVVGGSNPPCPTNSNPFPQNNLAASRSLTQRALERYLDSSTDLHSFDDDDSGGHRFGKS